MRYLLFLPVLIFVCCQSKSHQNQLVVAVTQAVLGDTAGEKSHEIQVLKQGEKVSDLDEVSDFESVITLGDTHRQAPWLRVKTAGNKTGWIFGGAVEPMIQTDDNWLLQKRMQCYFGKALALRRNQVIGVPAITTESDFAIRYRSLMALRDTFVLLLAGRSEPGEVHTQPDFSWLVEVLPGFIYQKVAGGTQPYLFADYVFFQDLALKTNGTLDDLFIETCLTAFSADSIESFFPAWKFQLSDYEAASQLGTGIHLKMLRQIEKAMQSGPLFQPELTALKEAVLDDILDKKTVYWQPKELIVKEMNQILKANFSILNNRDRVALQARLAMFENPEANGVRVNLRSG